MAKRAILLSNLGSPEAPTKEALKAYLNEFLMDDRVIDMPWPLRAALVKGIILRTRPEKSALLYEKIWTDEGSPLIVHSWNLLRALRKQVADPVYLAMRYGQPAIKDTLKDILNDHPELEELFLVPLYPHYAMSTVETCVVKVQKELERLSEEVKLSIQAPFYNDASYIDALYQISQPYFEQGFDHLLFSYHGLPLRHLQASGGSHCRVDDMCCEVPASAHRYCYRHQVYESTRLLAEKAGLEEDQFSVAFQSRLGGGWMQPFADKELIRLAETGVKKLLVICPAFVSDCLETLEEIGMRGEAAFREAGGEELALVPCLNDHPAWVETLAGWCA